MKWPEANLCRSVWKAIIAPYAIEGKKKGKTCCINEYFSSENSPNTIWSSAKATSWK